MKVRIAPDAMEASHAFDHLDQILRAFLGERHRWEEGDPARVEESAWARDGGRAGRRVLDAVQKLLGAQLYDGREENEATRMHALTLTVTLAAQPPAELSPPDAVKALEMPAFVIVENGESDRSFLDSMIRAFGRHALADAMRRGFWEIVHAGGGNEIPKRVAERVAQMGAGPRRVLILSDSDRLTPGEETKTVRQISRCAQDHGVIAILLSKREIENYLPYDALWDCSGRRERCGAFLQLTQGQRDHYDVKKGFGRDPETGETVVPDAQRMLFDGVRPKRVLDDLVGGFGDKVWSCFQSTTIDEASIRAICPGAPQEDEIPRMLDAIERLL